MMIRHEIVMQISQEPSSQVGVLFRAAADEDGNPSPDRLYLGIETWRDMGEPPSVVVAVRPGDGFGD